MKRMKKMGEKKREANTRRVLFVIVIIAFFAGILVFYFSSNWIASVITLVGLIALSNLYVYFRKKLELASRIARIESVFPDFLQLMASNLRAGMTIDRAILLSSRKEFAPLDSEIVQLGKDLVTGKEVEVSLNAMADRIGSEKIKKTIFLLNTGIRSGGNLAVLLEETAVNMRERGFIEKRAASNVLMYVIFIFFAVAIGAPALFGLSSVLVKILSSLLANIPTNEIQTSVNLPFTLTSISVPVNFITYYCLVFIIAMSVLGSLVLGLVSKGDEKAGVRYILPITALSVGIFLIVRFGLESRFASLFG